MTLRSQSSTRLLSALISLSYGIEAACVRNYPAHSPSYFSSNSTLRFLSTSYPRYYQASTNAEPSSIDVDEAKAKDVKPTLGSSQSAISTSSEAVEGQAVNLHSATVERSQNPNSKGFGRKIISFRKPKNFHGSEQQPTADVNVQRPKEDWQIQKRALKTKFGDQGWSPRKKLSPDTMEGIRALHQQYPDKYTTPVLAEQFKVSPEAIRRILKSKWRPSPEKMEERRQRWAKRHDRIWDAQAEMGLRPRRKKDRQPEGPEKLDDIIPLTPNVGP